MSYRELRNFSEMLRALDYPRPVSIENFRTPNFRLVAEILAWLTNKFEPDYDLSLTLDNEQDRVIFIKTAALFFIQKARIKINPKKLYQADGYAVQEMLKVTSVLYEAVKNQSSLHDDDIEHDTSAAMAQLSAKIATTMADLRTARQLAAEIPERGATLYDLLTKEVDLKERRMAALARPMELADVEKSVKSSVRAVDDEIKQTLQSLSNIAADEQTLDAKIEKKTTDLDRQQKRLAQLQSHRPAYMDEYEALEVHMKTLYTQYVLKFRNVTYVEHMQQDFDKIEQERNMEAELSLRRLAEQMREDDGGRMPTNVSKIQLPREDSDAERPAAPVVQGNITGAGLSDDDDDTDTSLPSNDEEYDSDALNTTTERIRKRAAPVAQASIDAGDDVDARVRAEMQNSPPPRRRPSTPENTANDNKIAGGSDSDF